MANTIAERLKMRQRGLCGAIYGHINRNPGALSVGI
jgi:hypothetical protein